MSFDGQLGKKKWAGLLLQRLKIDLDVILSLGGGKIPTESQPTNQPEQRFIRNYSLFVCSKFGWVSTKLCLPRALLFNVSEKAICNNIHFRRQSRNKSVQTRK